MFLDFFDEVYVINLPKRIDRRMEIEKELTGFGIPHTFWAAIEHENGAHGLFFTMKELFAHILSKRQSRVIIFEDDATFLVKNPKPFLREIIPQIPTDFDMLELGLNLLSAPIRVSENILKVRDAYSTHAIVYSYEGVRVALQELNQAQPGPYDIFLRNAVIPRARTYCTFPMMATQRKSYSDIEKSETKWHELMMMSFNQYTKNLVMAQEIAYCIEAHQINGETPVVNTTVFEVQHPELVGRTCDCGRFTYEEGKCQTCGGDKWKVIWREK